MTDNAVAELSSQLEGEVRADRLTQLLYSSDASLYEILPRGVVMPRHERDCQRLVKWAADKAVPLTPRGGGTSLAGQAVGKGWIVDVSRHMRHILEIDPQQRRARVEPGVIIDELNRACAPHGLMFAPDPSTYNRCNIGGAIGNNAWGAHALRDGMTRDHVEALRLVTGEGDAVSLKALSATDLKAVTGGFDSESLLHRAVITQIGKHHEEILRRYPAPAVPCNAGYGLREVARGQPWSGDGAPFNLASLICGAEGTLGLVTQATIKLVPRPRYRVLVAGHFSHLEQAMEAVLPAVRTGAATVELIDAFVLGLVAGNLEARKQAGWIFGEPQAILLAEYMADDADEIRHKAAGLEKLWTSQHGSYKCVNLEQADTDKAWAIRRSGLGLLMGMKSPQKPATFVEDSAVAVERLTELVSQVQQIMARRKLPCVFYGSVGMGLIHLRPLVDLSQSNARHVVSETAAEVCDVLRSLGGTASAKHGDGRARSHFLRKFLGGELIDAMAMIKSAFDPRGIFNPGVIVEPGAMTENWRSRLPTEPSAAVPAFFRWDEPGGAVAAGQRCQGAGLCRRRDGAGTMCPSYRATLEEQHSTRGRGNVLRQIMASEGFSAAMAHPLVHEAMSLCLACKGCRAECPANVDMARLKSEHLAHFYGKNGVPLQVRVLSHVEKLSRIASIAPGIANAIVNSDLVKAKLKIHPKRRLPCVGAETFAGWFKKHYIAPANGRGTIWLFNDSFTEFFDVDAGRAAVEFLTRCGYTVKLSPQFGSLRVALSQGLIGLARRRLYEVMTWLRRENPGVVVGLEPAETLTFRDEAAALFADRAEANDADEYLKRIRLFDEFVVELSAQGHVPALEWRGGEVRLHIHGHCHQKALTDMSAPMTVLSGIKGGRVEMIASGCCGMAGFFGYDEDNYSTSMAVGEQVLFPAVRAIGEGGVVVAAGTSCRQQIFQGTGVVALHPAEVLVRALSDQGPTAD